MKDVLVALFGNKLFWYFVIFVVIVITGFANAELVGDIGERWIRAMKGVPCT